MSRVSQNHSGDKQSIIIVNTIRLYKVLTMMKITIHSYIMNHNEIQIIIIFASHIYYFTAPLPCQMTPYHSSCFLHSRRLHISGDSGSHQRFFFVFDYTPAGRMNSSSRRLQTHHTLTQSRTKKSRASTQLFPCSHKPVQIYRNTQS